MSVLMCHGVGNTNSGITSFMGIQMCVDLSSNVSVIKIGTNWK